MGEISGKVLSILATVAVFALIVTQILWPAIESKGEAVETQITESNIGGEGSTTP